jgi:hypothetical protein
MDVAMKDPNVMSIFTEGSHHRNVSVLFLSQNIFHQGKHSRTMSLNVQYMVLFKNARDKAQVQTLARQMFPTDWRSFLQHFEEETSKEYGHVIIDLHPSTPDDQRIVSTSTQTHEMPSPSFADQYFKMSNPYAQPLMDAQKKLNESVKPTNGTAEDQVKDHAAALNEYTLMRDKYKLQDDGKQTVMVNSKQLPPPDWETPVSGKTVKSKIPTPVVHSKQLPPPDWKTPVSEKTVKRKRPTPDLLTPPTSEKLTRKRFHATGPPGIHLKDEELVPIDEDVELMHYGKILSDGTDPKLLSFMDTDEQREKK